MVYLKVVVSGSFSIVVNGLALDKGGDFGVPHVWDQPSTNFDISIRRRGI